MIELEELRKKIDLIDIKIIELIEKRAKIVKKIGEIKAGERYPIYVPEREAEIFKRVSQISKNLSEKAVKSIFTEIISACRALEKEIKVLNIGNGTEKIGIKVFGNSVKFKSKYKEIDRLDKIDFEKFDFIIASIKEVEKEKNEKLSEFIKSRKVIEIDYKEDEKLKKYILIFVKEVDEGFKTGFTINIE